jgi:hypothetical protein
VGQTLSGAFDQREPARAGAGLTTNDLGPPGTPATPTKSTLTASALPRTTNDIPPASAPVQKQAAAMDTAAAVVPAATASRPVAPASRAASAAAEDGRVAGTAARPQLAQRGHAMQYYRLHQPAFLDAVRTRLLAASLAPGSPQLSWTSGPARFVEQLGFALTGPEAKELPELLYPSDPWALIDAHRTMDADPTLATGAMGWSPAAGLALAAAFERSVRASLPRVAARYVAEQGTRSASLLVAAHPMDRVVAEALVADGVVALGASRAAGTGKAAGTPAGYDVQTGGIRLVMSYRWLGDVDPTLWHWLSIDDPADATLEEIAFALWSRTEYAYGLTRVGGHVAVPKEWARQVPGVQVREALGGPTFDRFERSSVEELAASKLADGAALVQGAHAAAGDTAQPTSATARARAQPEPHDSAPDRAQFLDALDTTSVILDELTRQLGPWGLAYVLDAGRSFVVRQRAALLGTTPDTLALWAPVITGQRAIVRDAATGVLEVQKVLAEAGVTPEQLSPLDRAQNAHPGLQVLYGYAQAAGTAQLVESARSVLAQARAAHAMLPVTLIARASQDAGHELSQLSHAGAGDPLAAARARALGADHAQLAGEVATLEGQVMATGRPDPVLLETAGLDAETIAFRARIAQLQASLSALGHALDAADQGAIAALANLSAGARMVMTGHHLDLASQALDEVETVLDASQPAAVNARYDAMPPSPAREYGRQFELRDTRKAQLAHAHERFAAIAKAHGLDGALFQEAEHALRDAPIRALVANVAVLLAVGVISGGVAAVAGDFAAGLVGGGRAVTTIGDATGALRTARIVGGVTNVVVDAGANAAAQTALNGDHLGSSFAENLLSNAAVRVALRPLHAAIRTWGGLDEEALALWTQQGARGKLALARTATVSVELVTAGATSYVVHRLTTLARGAQPDDETVATWAVQGATLVLARLIHTRLDAVMERLKGAGARAGELVARAARQQTRTLTYQSAEAIERGAAMRLLIEHQQLTQDEIAFWRQAAADPAALRTLGIDGEQATARLAAAEGQVAELAGAALQYLPLRLAGLEQEVEGSRLWVGDAEQIAEALVNARAAHHDVRVAPPPANAQVVRVWRVTLSGETIEIRERVRLGHREISPHEGLGRGGGRNHVMSDPTEDIIKDTDPTLEIRKLRDDARAAHPHDIEQQRDYIWRQLKTDKLRQSLLAHQASDVKTVSRALTEFGIAEATPKAIGEVFTYIFDSSGIMFTYENYAAWSRLASGRGRVTDARFIVHELTEVGILKNSGVDFMGRSMKVDSSGHQRWMAETFDPAYMSAHKQALRAEYQFLADQLARVAGESHRLAPEVVAAIDTNGEQARQYLVSADGRTVQDHPSLPEWRLRAVEPVMISPDNAKRLGVPERTTLGELLSAIREAKLPVAARGGTR